MIARRVFIGNPNRMLSLSLIFYILFYNFFKVSACVRAYVGE